jgi:hypothetical protein
MSENELTQLSTTGPVAVPSPIRPVDPIVDTTDDSISWEDIQAKAIAGTEIIGIPVPEWATMPDGSPRKAYLKMLSAREAIDMAKKILDPAKKADGLLELVQRCLVNPKTMEPIIPPAGIETFAKLSMKVFRRLQDACLDFNGMNDEKKEVEAAKNA